MKKWIHSVIAVLLACICLLPSAAFDASMVSQYDAIAFGCPSMGSEQLEESEFSRSHRGRCDFYPRGFADLGRC